MTYNEILYNTIKQHSCKGVLAKVYSVMADTMVVNTSEKNLEVKNS